MDTRIDTASKMRGRYRITVEMRPPLAGERGWWVDVDQSAEGAIDEVIAGYCDAAGYGWTATHNHAAGTPDDDDLIAVTVTVIDPHRPFPDDVIGRAMVRGKGHSAPVSL